MADAKGTLKTLLASLEFSNEQEISKYVDELDTKTAQQLIDLVMSGHGGLSSNLPDGQGGFLTGLRRILQGRAALKSSDLPENPRYIPHDQKITAIESFEQDLSGSDERMLEGLRLILETRTAESMEKFAAWPGELMDGDFPAKADKVQNDLKDQNEKLFTALRRSFEDQRTDLSALLKKHRSEADDKD